MAIIKYEGIPEIGNVKNTIFELCENNLTAVSVFLFQCCDSWKNKSKREERVTTVRAYCIILLTLSLSFSLSIFIIN